MNNNLEVPMWEKKPSVEEKQNSKNVIPQFPRKQEKNYVSSEQIFPFMKGSVVSADGNKEGSSHSVLNVTNSIQNERTEGSCESFSTGPFGAAEMTAVGDKTKDMSSLYPASNAPMPGTYPASNALMPGNYPASNVPMPGAYPASNASMPGAYPASNVPMPDNGTPSSTTPGSNTPYQRPLESYLDEKQLGQLAYEYFSGLLKEERVLHLKDCNDKSAERRNEKARKREEGRVEFTLNYKGQICECFINEIDPMSTRVLVSAKGVQLYQFSCKNQGDIPKLYELAWNGGSITFSCKSLDVKAFSKVLAQIDIGFDPRKRMLKGTITRLLGYLNSHCITKKLPRSEGLVLMESEDGSEPVWLLVLDGETYETKLGGAVYV